jgi:isopenicillin N synthase-like dioxygenase
MVKQTTFYHQVTVLEDYPTNTGRFLLRQKSRSVRRRRQISICHWASLLQSRLGREGEILSQYSTAGDFRGYKAKAKGQLEGRDNNERYNIPKFTTEHERPHPKLILDHFEEIKAFSLHTHNKILLPLLRLFAHVLELEDEDFFVHRHRYEEPGLEYLRYMKYHPSPNPLWAIGHTDYNTLTFLFHQPVAGLQVLTPEGWRYVRSNPGQIIVNVADALEF